MRVQSKMCNTLIRCGRKVRPHLLPYFAIDCCLNTSFFLPPSLNLTYAQRKAGLHAIQEATKLHEATKLQEAAKLKAMREAAKLEARVKTAKLKAMHEAAERAMLEAAMLKARVKAAKLDTAHETSKQATQADKIRVVQEAA